MVYLRYKDIDVNGTFYLRIFLLEIVLIDFFLIFVVLWSSFLVS